MVKVEVRSITKRIADLNEKLDSSTTLSEPRENAHMRFEYKKNAAYCDFMNAINNFGSIAVSKTFPALCMTKIEKPVVHLKTGVTLTTVDYHGNPRTNGADPVVVELKNPWGEAMPIDLKDNDDGTYTLNCTAHAAGRHKLCISIFDRPVKDSPFTLEVTEHNSPVQKIGSRGDGSLHFKQPINVVIDQHNNLCILDAGNSRIQILDRDGQYIGALANHGMEQHSGTGLALTPNNTFVVVNWRTKHVTELDYEGSVALKFTHEDFLAPTSVAVNRHGDIIIADNEACCLFMFSATGQFLRTIGTKGSKEGQFKLITAVAMGNNDEILVTDHRLQVFTRQGTFVTEVRPGSDVAKGQYHGVTVDRHGNILATRSNFVQVFNAQKKWVFDIDSFDDKLNRAHGLSATTDGHVYVADLGNDCLKVFRYM